MMNEETHNEKTADPLSRWWWPGQWLRIVYGVWVDQVWYWQNVRPQLNARKRRWGIFAQGILGSVLVTVSLSVILGGMLDTVGVTVDWTEFVRSVLVGTLLWGLVASIRRGPKGPALGVILSVFAGITSGVGRGVVIGVTGDLIGIAFLCIAFGFVVNLASGVTGGKVSLWKGQELVNYPLGWAMVVATVVALMRESTLGVVVAIVWGIVVGIAGGVGIVIGLYLGGWWVTRQVPDEATRCRMTKSARFSHHHRYD